jgi:patatin-like phospholipase/acyl hydrolase
MNQSPEKKFVKILSIDGGGIRGIIAGQFLALLEHKLQARTGNPESRLADYFDLIAGTGTGGILACAYLCPLKPHIRTARFSAAQVVDLYMKFASEVFTESLEHKIITLGGLLDEKYPAEELEKVFGSYFEDLHLRHLLKPSLITAYDITKRKAHFFTQHNATSPSTDFYVRDVARATSALPTFFESKEIQSLSGVSYPLIDGSVFANNPALCAVAEARKIFFRDQARTKPVTPSDLLVLSVGTGLAKIQYDFDDAKGWGLASWTKPLIDIVASSNSETVDYQLRQLYESMNVAEQYVRINPQLPVDVEPEIDNAKPENLRALKELGIFTAEAYEDKVDEFVKLLLV